MIPFNRLNNLRHAVNCIDSYIGTRSVSGTADRSTPPTHNALVGDDDLEVCRLDNDGCMWRYGKYVCWHGGAADYFGFRTAMSPQFTKASRPRVAIFLVDRERQNDCR